MNIGWWSHAPDLRVASTRIRGELVMRGLRSRGLEANWFCPGQPRPGVLVLAKRYDDDSLAVAARFQREGSRIVFDLCDNRFAEPGAPPEQQAASRRLDCAITLADRLVASTPALADRIAARPERRAPITVIGDLIDDLGVVPVGFAERLRVATIQAPGRRRLDGLLRDGRRGLVWFGNHGGPYAEGGMSDLLRLRVALEQADRHWPLFLTIISNHRGRYRELFGDWMLPTLYFDWQVSSFPTLLARHHAALIPITDNSFNVCKTDNRLVTALEAGLAVAADRIPSYEPYAEALGLGDWPTMLSQLLGNDRRHREAVENGRHIARKSGDPERLLTSWRSVLQG